MGSVVANIVLGLVTSVLSGGGVWLWQRASRLRQANHKAAFFGLNRGARCVIMMNHHWNHLPSVSRRDVRAMIDIALLAGELGSEVLVRVADEPYGAAGRETEFCVGGPDSNPRSASYVATYLPGVAYRLPPGEEMHKAIVVGNQTFRRERGRREYGLIARLHLPTGSTVFLIIGQASLMNQASTHFLHNEYRKLAKLYGSTERFCVVVRVRDSDVYGHELVELECDVTTAAYGVPSPVASP